MAFRFNQAKISSLANKFSLFHPSREQMIILYQMANFLSKEVGLEEKLCRNLLIQSYIAVQQSQKIFHFMVEDEIPAIRLKYGERVYLEIENNLIDLLENKDHQNKLSATLKQLFDIYYSKFGTR